MIIGIIGDTHFGISKWHDDSLIQGRDAFAKATQLSDAIIMTGDLFDNPRPSLTLVKQIVEILSETAGAKKWKVKVNGGDKQNIPPIIIIHGNHERQSRDKVNPVEFLSHIGLVVNGDDKVITLENADTGEKVAVHCMGDVPDERAKERIAENGFRPVDKMPNIFMFHQSLREVMYMGNTQWLSVKDLPKGYDLYVDGHIHNRKELPEHKLLIPGSTVITQLEENETGDKGIYLFDTETRKLRFVPIAHRPFVYKKLKFNGEGIKEIEDKVLGEIDTVMSEKYAVAPIVRIVLEGKVKQGVNSNNLKFNFKYGRSDGAAVSVLNKLSSEDLERKVEMIKELREKKVPLREMGDRIISEKMGKDNGNVSPSELSQLLHDIEEDPESVVKNLDEETSAE